MFKLRFMENSIYFEDRRMLNKALRTFKRNGYSFEKGDKVFSGLISTRDYERFLLVVSFFDKNKDLFDYELTLSQKQAKEILGGN